MRSASGRAGFPPPERAQAEKALRYQHCTEGTPAPPGASYAPRASYTPHAVTLPPLGGPLLPAASTGQSQQAHLRRLQRSPPAGRQPAQGVQPLLVLKPLPQLAAAGQRARRDRQPLAPLPPGGIPHVGHLV